MRVVGLKPAGRPFPWPTETVERRIGGKGNGGSRDDRPGGFGKRGGRGERRLQDDLRVGPGTGSTGNGERVGRRVSLKSWVLTSVGRDTRYGTVCGDRKGGRGGETKSSHPYLVNRGDVNRENPSQSPTELPWNLTQTTDWQKIRRGGVTGGRRMV